MDTLQFCRPESGLCYLHELALVDAECKRLQSEVWTLRHENSVLTTQKDMGERELGACVEEIAELKKADRIQKARIRFLRDVVLDGRGVDE